MRQHGTVFSNWHLCSRCILDYFFIRLYELPHGIICVVCIFNKLLKLSRGLLSGVDGINSMYGMSRRSLLRINRSHSSDGKLLFGIIFGSLSDRVLKLPRRFLPSSCRHFKLYGVSSWIVLRVDGSVCRDRCLRSGEIFGRVFNRLF